MRAGGVAATQTPVASPKVAQEVTRSQSWGTTASSRRQGAARVVPRLMVARGRAQLWSVTQPASSRPSVLLTCRGSAGVIAGVKEL